MDKLHLEYYPEITSEDFETLFIPKYADLYHNLGNIIIPLISTEVCRNKVGLNSYPSSADILKRKLDIAIAELTKTVPENRIIVVSIGMIWFRVDPNMSRLLSWLSSFSILRSLVSGDSIKIWTNQDEVEFPVLIDREYPDFLTEYQKRFPYITVYYTLDRQGLSEIGSSRFPPVGQPGNTSDDQPGNTSDDQPKLVMKNTLTGNIKIMMNSHLTHRFLEGSDKSSKILNDAINVLGIRRQKSETIDVPAMLDKLKILNYFPDLDLNLFTMCFISKTRTWDCELYKQQYGIYLRFQNYELLEYYGDSIMRLALNTFFYRIGQKTGSSFHTILSNESLNRSGQKIGICRSQSRKGCADILEAIFGLLYYQYGLVQMDRIIHYMINLQPIWEVVNSKIIKTNVSKLELVYQIKYPGTQFAVEFVYGDVYRYVMYNLQTGDRKILGYGNQNELGNQDSSGKLYKILNSLLG